MVTLTDMRKCFLTYENMTLIETSEYLTDLTTKRQNSNSNVKKF
jgi:hypothetical protein